jgi:hypothetical protein
MKKNRYKSQGHNLINSIMFISRYPAVITIGIKIERINPFMVIFQKYFTILGLVVLLADKFYM